MERFKKLFAAVVMMATILSLSVVVGPTASAAASAGDLIKMDGLSSVYFLAGDGKRYVFPNESTYFSWYGDFSSVKTISQSELESYPLGANVTVRPGTKLVKITTNPKVYAVIANGNLLAIPDEATAKALYGDNWNKRIIDISDAFFTNYKISTSVVSATAYPQGSLIKLATGADIYYIAADGKAQKITSEAAFLANRFKWNDVITTTLALPALGADITGAVATLTDTSSGAGGTAGAGTGLTVALSSATPASTTVPVSTTANQSATNVPYLKFNLTASSDGAVVVTSLVAKRVGVGSASDFSYVYLYEGDSRLTTGKSVNTSNNSATFTGLNYTVPAGTTKTLTLVADMASGASAPTSGTDSFQLEAASSVITNGAAVSGTFPVSGNMMSVASVTAGKLTVTAGVDPSAPSVGASGAAMAQFKLAATTEDIKVTRIALYQGGTISNSYLTNFKLYDGSTVLATDAAIDSQNLVSFILDTPYLITKGQTKTFDVKGDISGSAKNGDTIIFYIEDATDVYGVGQTYGFGVGVDFATSGTYDGASAANESNCTVSGGQLTFSTSGPVASNVRGNNVNFLNFNIAAGVNTEIKKLRLEMYYGGVKAGATSTDGEITNVRIVDTDTNQVVEGPLDLGNTSSWTDIGTTGDYHDFTDTIAISAGTTKHFKVMADLNDSLSPGGIYFVLGSTASAYTLSTTDGAKNTDNNQWITNIVPSSYITGNTMTFVTAALTVSAANTPATKTVSKGDQNVESLGIVLTPAQNQTATVTSVKVAGYLGGSTYNNFTLYSLSTDKITDTVSSVTLWDGTTQIGQTKSFDTSGYAMFDNLSVTVPSAGKTLMVKANLSSTATTTGAYAIEIPTPRTFVTAYDSSNNSITPDDATAANATINTTPSVYVKLSTGGSLNAYLNSAFPTAIVAGNTAVDMLSTKFYATNQAMTITKLRVTKTDTANTDASNISITYAKDAAGTMETVNSTFVGDVTDFTGLNIYVPKDGYSRDITLKAQLGEVGSGATSGDNVYLLLSTTNFEAVPADGGSTKATTFTGTVSGASDHVMYIRKGYPVVTTTQSSFTGSQTIAGVSKLGEFTVNAVGGTIALKKVKMTLTVSDGQYGAGYTDLTATDFKLFRNGTEVATGEYRIYKDNAATSTAANELDYTNGTGTVSSSTTAFYVVFDNGSASAPSGEETISAGATNTYAIGATVSAFESARDTITSSVTASADTDASRDLDLKYAASYYVALTGAINENFIWSDMNSGASHSSTLDTGSSADWHSGYKVKVN